MREGSFKEVRDAEKCVWQTSYPHHTLSEEWHKDLLRLEHNAANLNSEPDIFMSTLKAEYLDGYLRFWKFIGHSEAIFMLRKDNLMLVIWIKPVWDFPYAIFAYKDDRFVFGDRDRCRAVPGLAARNVCNAINFIRFFFGLDK